MPRHLCHNTRLPALLARVGALGLCTLAACALFVPGLVLGAEGDSPDPPAAVTATASAQTVPESKSETRSALTAPEEAVPSSPVPAEVASSGTALVTLPWGDGPGQVGLSRPAEGLARGPEALAIAPDGRIVVLDTVNRRLVLLDAGGGFWANWPLPLAEPRYLAVDGKTLYVLDPDTERKLLCLDWAGNVAALLAVPVLDDVVTGLFATDRGPCLEVAHDQVFVIGWENARARGTLDGRPVPAVLQPVAGRPLDRGLGWAGRLTFKPGQGIRLKSYKIDKKTLRATALGSAEPSLVAGRALEHLVSVDPDANGGLVLGARLLDGGTAPGGGAALVVARLKAAGDGGFAEAPTATIFLRDFPFAYVGLPYSVAPDGRVFQPMPTEAGYTILVHHLPGAAAQATPNTEPEPTEPESTEPEVQP
jgi:hypothetical protein